MKSALEFFSDILVLSGWPWFSKQSKGVYILMFHNIFEYQIPNFKELICYLKSIFNIVPPDNFNTYNSDRPGYILSFDDGYYSHFRIAKEVLEPMGIRALFFICPDFVGLTGERALRFVVNNLNSKIAKNSLEDYMPMSWDQIRSLQTQGHTIAVHTLSHIRLSSVTNLDYLRRQIIESGNECDKMLNTKVEWFAYSFGDIGSIDARSMKIISKRYKYCCSGIRGINSTSNYPFGILRENIELDRPLRYLKMVVGGRLDFFYYFDRLKFRRIVTES